MTHHFSSVVVCDKEFCFSSLCFSMKRILLVTGGCEFSAVPFILTSSGGSVLYQNLFYNVVHSDCFGVNVESPFRTEVFIP
jgi:hypothetical protein